ncbi:DUF4180 domain-containing protein [Candidatus Roizmanbacteria bacterium]|nr:DUF4180 domain-containing protein [Candidatus Roizmanbacteria bacterium]
MNAQIHQVGNKEITEIVTDTVIKNTQDAVDLLGSAGNAYVILYDRNFEPDFFDLSTRKLGEILQKFANYQVKLAIVGDFEKYPSKTLKEFIFESNRQGDYLFVASVEDAIERWSR